MAKKSTWEKRKQKVKKEEYLVLGGKTKRSKSSFTSNTSKTSNSDKSAEKGEEGGRKPRTRTGRGDFGKPKSEGGDRRGDRTDRTERSEQSGRFDRSNSTGRSDRPERSGRFDRSKSSGQSERTERGGRFDRSKSSGQGEKTERSGRFDRSNSSGRSERPDRGGRFDRSNSGGRSERPDRGGRFDRNERSDRGDREEHKFNPSDFITRDGDESANDRFKGRGNANKQFRQNDRKKSYSKFTKDNPFQKEGKPAQKGSELLRLNKYLSMAGICSRREADHFIEQGLVSVNGTTVTELGTKVKPSDKVEYAGQQIKAEAMRYILLNKPKDCITTVSDERGRSTVIGLVKNACKERVFPVGRLDRNTTGLILLTNDGDLADKLAHPSNEVRKVYHVITDKNVSAADLKKLETGVQLDDGIAKADAALFAGDGSVRNEIGLEIHSGRNRVVRRMFEALGYEVTRLDRAAFAGLSKKGLPRGRWRFLTDKELGYLKML